MLYNIIIIIIIIHHSRSGSAEQLTASALESSFLILSVDNFNIEGAAPYTQLLKYGGTTVRPYHVRAIARDYYPEIIRTYRYTTNNERSVSKKRVVVKVSSLKYLLTVKSQIFCQLRFQGGKRRIGTSLLRCWSKFAAILG